MRRPNGFARSVCFAERFECNSASPIRFSHRQFDGASDAASAFLPSSIHLSIMLAPVAHHAQQQRDASSTGLLPPPHLPPHTVADAAPPQPSSGLTIRTSPSPPPTSTATATPRVVSASATPSHSASSIARTTSLVSRLSLSLPVPLATELVRRPDPVHGVEAVGIMAAKLGARHSEQLVQHTQTTHKDNTRTRG